MDKNVGIFVGHPANIHISWPCVRAECHIAHVYRTPVSQARHGKDRHGSAGWAIHHNLSPEGTALVPERHCNFWNIVTNAARTIPIA